MRTRLSLAGLSFMLAAIVLAAQPSQAGGCTTADAGPTVAEAGRLVNAERQARGLGPVVPLRALGEAAESHACDMARRGYFSHESPSGETVMDRVLGQGYGACLIAENIAMGQRGPAQAVRAWMESPGHRRNILLPDAAEYGLGFVVPAPGQGEDPFWVLVLGRRC